MPGDNVYTAKRALCHSLLYLPVVSVKGRLNIYVHIGKRHNYHDNGVYPAPRRKRRRRRQLLYIFLHVFRQNPAPAGNLDLAFRDILFLPDSRIAGEFVQV